MLGAETMGRITSQVVAGIDPPPDEPTEEREYRERTEKWLARMRRDAEQRGLNLVVEIPGD